MQKLLTVGINRYPGAPLNGCVPDSNNVLAAWKSRGVQEHMQLLDEDGTAAQIKMGLRWLLRGARPYEDVLTFHYSGHGTQVRDLDGDERTDRLDESLCPVDFSWSNPDTWFTDDTIAEELQSLPEGVNLTLVIDACHSGSLMRAMVGEPLHLAGAGQRRARAYPIRDPGIREAVNATSRFGWRSLIGLRPAVTPVGRTLKETRKGVLLSATTAKQLAADALIDSQSQGAHTYALLRTLQRASWNLSYAQLVAAMRGWINANGFGGLEGQTPQLQGLRAARRLPVFQPFPRP